MSGTDFDISFAGRCVQRKPAEEKIRTAIVRIVEQHLYRLPYSVFSLTADNITQPWEEKRLNSFAQVLPAEARPKDRWAFWRWQHLQVEWSAVPWCLRVAEMPWCSAVHRQPRQKAFNISRWAVHSGSPSSFESRFLVPVFPPGPLVTSSSFALSHPFPP